MSRILPWWVRWAALGVLLAASVAFGAIQMHRHDQTRYDALSQRFAEFRATTKGLGEAAARHAAEQKIRDEHAKREADDANAKALAALTADNIRLRGERDRARGSGVPAAPPGSNRPDLACFDRPELERAYGKLVADVRGLADEGSEATVELNTAKRWTQSQ